MVKDDPQYVPLPHILRTINVDDLPEPVAQAVYTMVETLRRQLPTVTRRQHNTEGLLTKPGTVHGRIDRGQIYGDVL